MATTYSKSDREDLLTSGHQVSYWIDSADPLTFEPLRGDIHVPVAIVGGGIAGMSVAYCLSRAGIKVALFEDGYIGSGESGRTTGHLVNALDDRYFTLEKIHGTDNAAILAESHTAAIDFVEKTIREEGIACDFRRVEGYLFAHPTDKVQTLLDEQDATTRVGIQTELLSAVPGMAGTSGPCLKFRDQAQFHVMKYLAGLASACQRHGAAIYTETRITEIREGLLKAGDFTITADHVVIATNSPVNDRVKMHTKQHAYRTYVIAAKIPKGILAPALWWDTGDQESKWVTKPYNYVRVQPLNDQYDLLIHGGQDHKTGQLDAEGRSQETLYETLEQWLTEKFPFIQEVSYKWSGQVMEPVDSIAFIGRNPGDKQVYIATGDSGNGLTHGTIAGMLISDLVQGKENSWERVYDPARISLKAAGEFLREGANVIAQYGDYLKAGDYKRDEEIPPNHGGVITSGLKKRAVFRDADGRLFTFSAVCPHLGCVLQWNPGELTFDCPCHGSRFTARGKVINGPALADLKTIEPDQTEA